MLKNHQFIPFRFMTFPYEILWNPMKSKDTPEGVIPYHSGVGPLQTPLADFACIAQSPLSMSGAMSGGATAIGEQPLKGLPGAMEAGSGAFWKWACLKIRYTIGKMIKAHWNLEVSYFQSQIAIPKMDGSFDPIFNRLVVQFIIFWWFLKGVRRHCWIPSGSFGNMVEQHWTQRSQMRLLNIILVFDRESDV